MKKFYSLMAALVLAVGFINAQCTINAAAQTTPGANPTAATLPCVVRGSAYNQTVQGQIQASVDTTLTIVISVSAHIVVDSVRMDSITGLPAGITATWSPAVLAGGGNGCVKFTGTTNDPAAQYTMTAWGKAWTHIQANVFGTAIDTPYVYNGQLNQFSPFGNYYLTVINSGSACHGINGINNFSSDLNAAFSVYPNPSSGVFELKLNAGSRVNGEVVVVDLTGKKVFVQPLDVVGLYSTNIDLSGYSKGIYTVQLRTTDGFASKNISIE